MSLRLTYLRVLLKALQEEDIQAALSLTVYLIALEETTPLSLEELDKVGDIVMDYGDENN